MMKKAFILLMVTAVILNFAACNTSSEKNPSESSESSVSSVQTTKAVTTTKAPEPKTTTSETTTVIENPFAEKFEFNFLGNPEFVEGRWDKVELEEKFNVKFNFWDILVKSGANEQVDMMLAAGDVPDYGFYYKSGVYMVEQGLGRTVPLNLIKQYYPGYYKKMLEDAVGFHMNRVEGTEDLYYGLTALTPRATHTGYVPLWRLDWLENIGYEPENLTPMKSVVKPEWDDTVYFSTTKFSLDDVKEILRAFTEDDPDDNGITTQAIKEETTENKTTISSSITEVTTQKTEKQETIKSETSVTADTSTADTAVTTTAETAVKPVTESTTKPISETTSKQTTEASTKPITETTTKAVTETTTTAVTGPAVSPVADNPLDEIQVYFFDVG
jgi:hypothetical protein